MSRFSKLQERVEKMDLATKIRLIGKTDNRRWDSPPNPIDVFPVDEVLLMLLNELGYKLEKIPESFHLVKKVDEE